MQLPARVFERFNSYHIDLGRDADGKRRSKKLSLVADGESALFEALAKHARAGSGPMEDLFDDYILFGMEELRESTRNDYRGYIKRTLKPKFGHMQPDKVEPAHVAQFLEFRKKGGARVVANKEVACLSSVFQYGLRHGRCKTDPTRGIRRNKVKPRDRYVRDDEFLSHLETAPEWLQDVMWGCYLMELRPDEARQLLRDKVIRSEGVVIEESKRGKVKVVQWSPALRFFVDRAVNRVPKAKHVFTNSEGEPITKWAMASAMKRLRKKLGLTSDESFHFHDLRAKGESEHANGGHELLTLYKRAKVFRPVG